MGALFQLSYDELREAFVRGRFAEEQHFRFPCIEDWLARQRRMGTFPDDGFWDRLIDLEDMPSMMNEHTSVVLRQYAQDSRRIPVGKFEKGGSTMYWQDIDPLLTLLFKNPQARIYFGREALVIVCYLYRGKITWLCAFDGIESKPGLDVRIRPVDAQDVMSCIYASWMRGGPKSLPAQNLLCKRLTELVAKVRQQAESDFDSAVAVSADGLKVLPADKVIVYDGQTVYAYGPGAFRERKILRTVDVPRHDVGANYFTKPPAIFRARLLGERRSCEQAWFVCVGPNTRIDKRIFVTHRKYCPDPLPEPIA